MKKVMFISSCGGHLTELLCIDKIFKYIIKQKTKEEENAQIKKRERYNSREVK